MDIQIGKFDREVTFYQPTTVESSTSGSASQTYASAGSAFAYFNDRMNNEQFQQYKRTDVRRITLDVRYDEAPEALAINWQLEYDGLRYDVVESVEAPEYGRKKVRRIRAQILI
jgi:SPP1 family predicted phage head-tail adaptor